MPTSPHVLKPASVRTVMGKVLLALLPGIAAYVHFFGPAILVQIAIASVTALAAEALILKLRDKPVMMFLSDGSALVTAWLIALTFPPIAPWWLTVLGVLIAIVIAKHLYGGLGQNPFNPAMVAFCAMIVAYPQLMSQWPRADLNSFGPMWQAILSGDRQLDAIVMATPLDACAPSCAILTRSPPLPAFSVPTPASAMSAASAGNGWPAATCSAACGWCSSV